MIVRIVRMTFSTDSTDTFLALFASYQEQIRRTQGCLHLELWQDTSHPECLTTYSHWESEAALNAYRESPLFQKVWAATKPLFADKPMAHSYKRLK